MDGRMDRHMTIVHASIALHGNYNIYTDLHVQQTWGLTKFVWQTSVHFCIASAHNTSVKTTNINYSQQEYYQSESTVCKLTY